MVRKNGFLQITDYERIRFCDPKTDGISCYDWIRLEDKQEYLFKCGTIRQSYAEVFWSYVLNYLGVRNVQYDLAEHDGFYGVLTKDYNPEQFPTYSLYDILNAYRESNHSQYGYLPFQSIYNLQDLKKAYEYCFKNNYGEDCITQLNMETFNRFSLQILLGDIDAHARNTEIWINKSPQMAPLYDFGRYGRLKLKGFLDDYILSYDFSYEDEWVKEVSVFERFRHNATREELEIFKNWMTKIRDINTKHLFDEMECQIENHIPIATQYNLKRKLIRNTKKAEKLIK